MTKKERRFVIEGVAILCALTLLILFVMPAMTNARDSVAFVIGVLMAAGAVGWLAWFLYRINTEMK
jgi:hypothetical protein